MLGSGPRDDLIGIEVGGAIKNVLAIAAGASDGLGFGNNARREGRYQVWSMINLDTARARAVFDLIVAENGAVVYDPSQQDEEPIANPAREDFIAAIDLLTAGAVPVDEIISAEFDFEHSAEAFRASADPENVKVVVTMAGGLT